MGEPINVLWLTKGLGRGGAEMLLVSLARALNPADVRLTVAYVLPAKNALVPDLEEANVEVRLLGSGKRTDWIPPLRDLLRPGAFQVVHSHAPVIGSAARLLAPRDTVIVHTEHNVWRRYRVATRWANAATLSRNEVVWAVSESVARSVQPRPFARPRAVEVMLHGIDPARVRRGGQARQRARELLGVTDDVFVIGTVGNLTPKKDHDTLVRSLALVRRSHAECRLVIVGTGPREAHLRGVIDSLGLTEHVTLLGIRDDVPELLPGLDLFTLSSLHEGLSIALVEAMATGLPVVATRVGGIPEVVQHGRQGLLVEPRNPRAMAHAIISMVEDKSLVAQCVQNGLESAEHFTIRPAADELLRQYRRLSLPGPTGMVMM